MPTSKYRPSLDLSCHPPRVAVTPLDDVLAVQLVERLLLRLRSCGYGRVPLDVGPAPRLSVEALSMIERLEAEDLVVDIASHDDPAMRSVPSVASA